MMLFYVWTCLLPRSREVDLEGYSLGIETSFDRRLRVGSVDLVWIDDEEGLSSLEVFLELLLSGLQHPATLARVHSLLGNPLPDSRHAVQ